MPRSSIGGGASDDVPAVVLFLVCAMASEAMLARLTRVFENSILKMTVEENSFLQLPNIILKARYRDVLACQLRMYS